jgi:hypothetical protein
MRRYVGALVLVIALFAPLASSAYAERVFPDCVRGSGNVVSEPRSVNGFSAVTLNGVGKLIIEQTGTESLTVTADDNIVPLLTSEVRDGVLVLDVKPNTCITQAQELTYRVTVADVRAVTLGGAGDVDLQQISVDALDVAINGTGQVTAAGSVDQLAVVLAGTGAFQGENLASRIANARIDGSGSIIVQASDALNAVIAGVGTIEYIGDPQVTQLITGIGAISKRSAPVPFDGAPLNFTEDLFLPILHQ